MEQDALQYHLLKVFSELENRIAQRIVNVLSDQSIVLGENSILNEKLLKDVELCEALQISTAHFYKVKRRHKDFPVYDIDGAKRYKLSEVEQFIKSLKQ